jgi:hypothetical protein
MASVFQNTNGMVEVVLGDSLNFILTSDGTDVLDKYEVFRVRGNTVTAVHGSNPRNLQALSVTTGSGTVDHIYVPQGSTTGSTITTLIEFNSTDFTYGDKGIIVGYDTGLSTNTYIQPFQVVRGKGIEKLWDVETSDADAEATNRPNTLVGRAWTVEKNQRDVLMPRLKRALGLLGEHQIVDAFLYDDDGNITECRLRFFETKQNAIDALKWEDRLNEVDPRIAQSPVTGELAVYTITASNLLPRNLRTLFEQKIDADESDNLFGTGSTEGSTGSVI